MSKTSLRILRLGLGLTFLWIGLLIWRDPELWGGFIQPWAKDLLILSVEKTMKSTAILDMLIGIALIVGLRTWIASAVAVLHLLVVIVTVGFSDVTVRDFGLLAASVALCWDTLPTRFKSRFSADTLA